MNRIYGWLLDTHAMLWMLYGDSRLSSKARERIESESPIAYSTISFWEIALKRSRKRFDFKIESEWDTILPIELERIGVARWDIEASDCRRIENLPAHHNDPFDRMLIAQATCRNYGILSRDSVFADYDVNVLW